MLDYFNRVSIFDHSTIALVLILGASWAFTLIHVLQEWKGEKVPLWRVFGAVVGVRVPNWAGFLGFTVALPVTLWIVGLAGSAGWLPVVGQLRPESGGAGALGALIGARVGDSIISHWGLYSVGYRPNPGLSSTILYSLEAIFILATFWTGLSLGPVAAGIGFVFGAGFFALVLPAIRLFRLVPSLRREPWVRWTPLPDWAQE